MLIARTYATLAVAHAAFLVALGVYMLRHGGHGAPAGLPLLLASALFGSMFIFLWRGRIWAAAITLVASFFPGVWPVLWFIVTASAPAPDQPSIVVAGRRLFFPWWEFLLLLAPVVFAVLTVLLVLAKRGRLSAK